MDNNIESVLNPEGYEEVDEIVWESAYVRGEVTESRIPSHKRMVYREQLVSALKYIHSMNVLHRDIHSANILVKGDRAVIADFGLSISHVYSNVPGLAYAAWNRAPEVDDRLYGFSADVYALGVTLIEMEVGIHPFGTNAPRHEVLSTGLKCISDTNVREYLLGMIEVDPSKRVM